MTAPDEYDTFHRLIAIANYVQAINEDDAKFLRDLSDSFAPVKATKKLTKNEKKNLELMAPVENPPDNE